MPSKSVKQARTMRAAAHDPEFAAKVGIPRNVAEEFVAADERKRKREQGHHDRVAKVLGKRGK